MIAVDRPAELGDPPVTTPANRLVPQSLDSRTSVFTAQSSRRSSQSPWAESSAVQTSRTSREAEFQSSGQSRTPRGCRGNVGTYRGPKDIGAEHEQKAYIPSRWKAMQMHAPLSHWCHIPEVNDPTVGVGIRGRSVAAPWRRDGPVAA